MAKRRHTPAEVEARILTKSARRCCLCFALNADFREKKGQIAHLDKDPGNSTESNLAFLCFEHHSAFDSTNSQHKNYTIKEIELAQKQLFERVASRNGRSSMDFKYGPDGFTLFYDPKVLPEQLKAVVEAMSENYERLGGRGFILDQDTGKDDTDA